MTDIGIIRSDQKPLSSRPRIALALGGGGARGIAHILMLEVFDEFGVRPSFIIGTSIGAVYGAAYAAGHSAGYIRAHTEEVLSQRLDLIRQLISARAAPVQRLFNLLPLRAGLLHAPAVLERVMPHRMPATFADLAIPLAVVATDFHAQEAVTLTSGPLLPSVAASMALPALFEPVVVEGRPLIDGGLVNPLPFDLVGDRADVTVAVDVSGGAKDEATGAPGALEALMASTQIMQRAIVREKLRAVQPDIFIESSVERFNLIEFYKFKEILASAAPAKEALKRHLGRLLESETIALPAPEAAPAIAPPKKKRRLSLPVGRKSRK